jgi:hypothetical protein
MAEYLKISEMDEDLSPSPSGYIETSMPSPSGYRTRKIKISSIKSDQQSLSVLELVKVTDDFTINTDRRLFVNTDAVKNIKGTLEAGLPDDFVFGIGNRVGVSKSIELYPYPNERLPFTSETGSSLSTSSLDSYTEMRKAGKSWIATTMVGEWTDMLNAPDQLSVSAILGLDVPVTGITPVTATTPDGQYSGTVTWSPSDTVFISRTAYTATVSLTPGAGYTLVGLPADFFTVAGSASVHNLADSGVVMVMFPETVACASITIDEATGVTFSTSTLSGEITDTGGNNPAVTLYWGTTDGNASVPGGYRVSGAGSTALNGDYVENGVWNDKPKYIKTGSPNFYMYWEEGSGFWGIGQDFGDFPWYYSREYTSTPPLSGYYIQEPGESPEPTLELLSGAGVWDNNSAPTSPPQPQGIVSFTKDITGLTEETKYYYSAKAVNSAGTTWVSETGNFTTERGFHSVELERTISKGVQSCVFDYTTMFKANETYLLAVSPAAQSEGFRHLEFYKFDGVRDDGNFAALNQAAAVAHGSTRAFTFPGCASVGHCDVAMTAGTYLMIADSHSCSDWEGGGVTWGIWISDIGSFPLWDNGTPRIPGKMYNKVVVPADGTYDVGVLKWGTFGAVGFFTWTQSFEDYLSSPPPYISADRVMGSVLHPLHDVSQLSFRQDEAFSTITSPFYIWIKMSADTALSSFMTDLPNSYEQCSIRIFRCLKGDAPARFGNAVSVESRKTSFVDNAGMDLRSCSGTYLPTASTYGSLGRNVYKCASSTNMMWQDGNFWNVGQLMYFLSGGWESMYSPGSSNGRMYLSGSDYNDNYANVSIQWDGVSRWVCYKQYIVDWDNWIYGAWAETDHSDVDSDMPPTTGWGNISLTMGPDPYSWGGTTQTYGTDVKPPLTSYNIVPENTSAEMAAGAWGTYDSYYGKWSYGDMCVYDVQRNNDLTPVMTSNTTPTGIITSSSYRDDLYNLFNKIGRDSANNGAPDGTYSLANWISSTVRSNQFVTYQFPSPVSVTSFRVFNNIGPWGASLAINQYKLWGSNNNESWIELAASSTYYYDNAPAQIVLCRLAREYMVSSPNAYSYYKVEFIDCLQCGHYGCMGLSEIELYGLTSN